MIRFVLMPEGGGCWLDGYNGLMIVGKAKKEAAPSYCAVAVADKRYSC